ncbi:hypothetical protein DSM106972_039430 [Dulcicalothrix desertica PCC 7102]|uniref:PEP-CTERM protein-sorting domain-containing protein n=1 Tax=Dulcicalothrix desertica PCC 7102 TaxID=232991 RepID=A0A3S1IZP5_9CYAN|nr:PEP-CTERM sorting domain-containing protein [Dulcicalothrix desertica]RUT05122.1 hypothetical protein DSM106972_039430 [Dulcicalothrix desertica PCC 7102]TWH43369.1 putative secreted protein with PEP-CTERM sorting signal [Dulcicalothrix desertica PCC 7102]
MANNSVNRFASLIFGTVLSLGAAVGAAPAKALTVISEPSLNESWSFSFKDYSIEHQGGAVIDLNVGYKYKNGIGKTDPFEYPEFTQLYNYIDNYLVTYPNETDFWEILNKNLVTDLLTKPIPTTFGFDYKLADVVDNLTVDIDVKPGSSGINIPRSSTVTGTPGSTVQLDESWNFAFKNYPIQHQGGAVINLDVSYDYKDGIGKTDPFEYPEFTQIYNYIDKFLVQYPNETDFWEILNKNLVSNLLTKPIPTAFGFDYKLADVVDNLSVKIDVLPGSSGINIARSSQVTGIPTKSASVKPISVPEPGLIVALGVIALAGLMRRRKLATDTTDVTDRGIIMD